LTQTDAAGNTSEMSDVFSFTIVSPTTTLALLQSENIDINLSHASLVDQIDLSSLETKQIAVTPLPSVEKVSLNDILVSSNQHDNQLDEVLNQFASTSSTSTNDVVDKSLIGSDFIPSIKPEIFDQFDILQHAII
jgi:hypothetical protein